MSSSFEFPGRISNSHVSWHQLKLPALRHARPQQPPSLWEDWRDPQELRPDIQPARAWREARPGPGAGESTPRMRCPPPSIFPTEGSNLCLLHLLHWQANSLPLSHLGNPFKKVSWSKICTKLNPLPLITTSHQLYGPCLGFPVETFFFGTLYWFTMDSSKSEVMSEVCKTSLPI